MRQLCVAPLPFSLALQFAVLAMAALALMCQGCFFFPPLFRPTDSDQCPPAAAASALLGRAC